MRIAIALLVLGCSSGKPAEDPEGKLLQRVRSEKPLSVTYSDLLREYQANEVAADQKYKGVVLSVPGMVRTVAKQGDAVIVHVSGGADVRGEVRRR